MEVSGESPGRLFGRLILPDVRAVGAGLPGLPGSCHSELLPPSPTGRTATTVALLLHALPRPGFSETFTVGRTATTVALLLHALPRPGFSETFTVGGVDGVFSSGF